jgi:hypothetical protein
MPEPRTPPGQRPGSSPELAEVVWRGDQDDGHDGTADLTSRAFLTIILQADQPPVRLAESGQSADED